MTIGQLRDVLLQYPAEVTIQVSVDCYGCGTCWLMDVNPLQDYTYGFDGEDGAEPDERRVYLRLKDIEDSAGDVPGTDS